MSRLELILIIFLIVILLIYLTFISYIIINIYLNNRKQVLPIHSQFPISASEKLNINSPFQTDFFNKSAEHAEKILFGKVFIQEYGEPGYYGNKLLDVINRLNEETKKNIIIAIKYMCIEPMACRSNEKLFRMFAEQEKVPLWFLILREGVRKAVPEFMQKENKTENENSKIVPLFNVA